MVKFGIAFGIFLLRSVIISAAEECDDSAYLQRQRQQSQPMTPLAPSYTFMEVGTKGSIEANPEVLTCGAGDNGDDMYNFGGPNQQGTCLTVNDQTPGATICPYSKFNIVDHHSTCWYPYQGSTDYCIDTFEPQAVSQVTIEGVQVPVNEATQNGKMACFTVMPVQFCPKYVCVQSRLETTDENASVSYTRNC